MNCPKCHRTISDNATVCPYCHKVLALTCPNCHSISKNPVCKKCGYIILEHCHKCGKLIPTTSTKCKCGFPTSLSVAYNECEIDEFASLTVSFGALRTIKNLLNSQELYSKFLIKLKNLISAHIKGLNAQIVMYGNSYVINFCKELSFASSVDKAVRTALKLVTAFSGINLNMIEQLGSSLKMDVTIIKKTSDTLLEHQQLESNIKMIVSTAKNKKYLKDMQVLIDQHCRDVIRNYKTDSLYFMDLNGASVMFYQILLDEYIVPPTEDIQDGEQLEVRQIKKTNNNEQSVKNDLYGFNIFDINAKCSFVKSTTENIVRELDINKKIISIKTAKENGIKTSDLVNYYRSMDMEVIYITCNEELNYRPWGFFDKLFKAYFKLSATNGLVEKEIDLKPYNTLKNMLLGDIDETYSAEDARYRYMEQFVSLLRTARKHVIIVEGFEHIDNTSLQTLELYFDKYVNIYTNFIFITDTETSVHSKIKSLLQTFLYKEISIIPSNMDEIISTIGGDASDFIQSFYYERIKENYKGSRLYFEHAIKYLIDMGVLVHFDNKLLIKNNSSFMLPTDFSSLVRTRLKSMGKYVDASMILAYSVFLGERLDFATLEQLGINKIEDNVKFLETEGFAFISGKAIYINNYNLIRPIILASLKKDVEEFIVKNILTKLGKLIDNTTLMFLMGALSMFKEEYLLLWKNSQFSIAMGDYDAYLKNCLGYLSLIDRVGENIPPEEIENNKKDILQNILMSLYSYSPSKIYSIGDILLMDAMQEQDNDKIVKLSNLMLQSALITANYKIAQSLLHNILSRMPNSSLVVDGAINTKFLLLSVVNIEILFNIGNFRSCIELAEDMLNIIKPEIIQKIKPGNFSENLFIEHLMEAFRIAGMAKIITCDNNIKEFFDAIYNSLGAELPDKDALLSIKEFIAGKIYTPSNIELATPFSKIIYLILNEISKLQGDYKSFAQNIYQAKLLAGDMHQTQLEYLCEALIGYAYAKAGVKVKAEVILSDIIEKAENSAIFTIVAIAKYLLAKVKIASQEYDDAIIMINDSLADIQKYNNQAKIYYAMFERLYVDIAEKQKNLKIDTDIEMNKLKIMSPNGELERIIRLSEYTPKTNEEPDNEPENEDDLKDLADKDNNFSNLKTQEH